MAAETAIAEALMGRLGAFTLAPAGPDLPIAWPGRVYKPVEDKGYLRATILRATPRRLTAGISLVEHKGLFQIDMFWPINKGETEPLKVADKLAYHFRTGWADCLVKLDDPPQIMTAWTDGAWFVVPVRIPYRAII
ncbi:hypothetical protein FHS82_001054 [Pseudochelatococcus lubricantis]|uniref:Uncharacterized protein n=1 Tax=Pseudochelatococcus lubricantis TaxID=1538102 RepID=A0ABX0UW99_9HYPH|nr:phage tail terminator-like protein [Pseudochelatococcus lubricantis]NIJ57228.1 hypothetical protein [Pseudochelatococcus lubricantis]